MSGEVVHWRDATRPVKFFFLDVQAIYPFALWLVFPHVWLLEIAAVVAFFFTILGKYGISLVVFFRLLRTALSGSRKIATPWWVA